LRGRGGGLGLRRADASEQREDGQLDRGARTSEGLWCGSFHAVSPERKVEKSCFIVFRFENDFTFCENVFMVYFIQDESQTKYDETVKIATNGDLESIL
jgi:hypothetical protein